MDDLLEKLPVEIREKYRNQLPVPVVSIASDLHLEIYETDDLTLKEAGYIKKEGDKYVIYLNILDSPTRKRFTIAHEIGHFLYDKNILDTDGGFLDHVKQPVIMRETNTKMPQDKKEQEVRANNFAAQLLMPEAVFKKAYEEFNTIEEVATKFNTSVSAATIRGKELFGNFIT